MKKGAYYFELLSEEEQENYKQACGFYDKGLFRKRKFKTLMKKDFESFFKFIVNSFMWAGTPEHQGFYYWDRISKENRENN